MGVFDIFSKRQARQAGKKPDVYQYESIPNELRVQIVHVLGDLIGNPHLYLSKAEEVYQKAHNALAREYGLFKLANGDEPGEILFNFILTTASAERVVDTIEIALAWASKYINDMYDYKQLSGSKITVSEAIRELNYRFLEHGVGYQYENGHMIRVDSQFIHSEVVKPALILLSDRQYAGAEQEFLNAHKHYQAGRYKECLVECLKAFESTMKAICQRRKWSYKETDPAKLLLDVLFQNGLIPSSLQNETNNLRALLESGVPTLRNKMGGHGQGTVPTSVPAHLAAYGLHLTAANIVLLVSAAKV